jgi:N-methylhydantoinase B/oxoprolinase/acetone carboxylase alpha subunit
MELKSVDGMEVQAGDRLVLETPGGGGFGLPVDASAMAE